MILVYSYVELNIKQIKQPEVIPNDIIFNPSDATMCGNKSLSSFASCCHDSNHVSHDYQKINIHQNHLPFSHDHATLLHFMQTQLGFQHMLPPLEIDPNKFQPPQINASVSHHNHPMYLQSPQLNVLMDHSTHLRF